jgi:lysylphosphatidylglycerol synthetase-like protein (DUF2156 family)
MNAKKIKILFVLIVGATLFLSAPLAKADLLKTEDEANVTTSASNLAGDAGYNINSNTTVQTLIGAIIQIVLGFLGVIFVILIIISGYQWMMAGGNSDAINKARDRMINAIIGLVIVLAAYAIAWFVTNAIVDTTGVINE